MGHRLLSVSRSWTLGSEPVQTPLEQLKDTLVGRLFQDNRSNFLFFARLHSTLVAVNELTFRTQKS